MKRSLSLAGVAVGALLLGQSTAQAHINMLGALKSRGGDEKQIPCDGSKGANVYTFEPGAIITLGVTEAIHHDSYFRIAFDNDGQDGLKEPASIDPINPNRVAAGLYGTAKKDNPKCLVETADKCGQPDFCNVVSPSGATVLWDNIDPHLGDDSADTYTWTIQLPNVECENCVLQVLQVMEDTALGAHGPFDGDGDIYHRCIDIKLKKGAGTTGPGNAAGATVKVGTPNPKFPDANKNCLGGTTTSSDAGVSTSDAGPADAGTASDAGSPRSGDASSQTGSTAGTAGGGAVAGGTTGSPGGTTSGTGSVGGTTSGTGATAGTVGSGTTAGVATTGGGIAPTGGTGTTTSPVGAAPSDDDDGCSVAFGGPGSSGALLGGLAILALMFVRRFPRRG